MIAPPPPTTDKRPIAFYDTECFPNYWLLKFRAIDGAIYDFRLQAGARFEAQTVARIRLLFDAYCVVSFNGNYYDVSMITAALSGYTCEQLKWLNDKIIVEKAKPWELGLPEWKPSDHIDVMEVAPGMGSQKQYAGRIHYKTMRDLPYNPGRYLTEAEIVEVDQYCGNDLNVLEALFNALSPQIYQRELLSKRYDMDLRSKSDAQLAEAVLKHRCEQVMGCRLYKPNIDWNLKFRYKVPSYISFQTPQLQRALDLVREAIFAIGPKGSVEMPQQLEGLLVPIGQGIYKLGIGGLHSQEKCRSIYSNDTHVLRDSDVASYYPSLILNSGTWPSALGITFLQEYAAIKSERLAAKSTQAKLKKAGDTKSHEYEQAYVGNEGGKIFLNGSFGKLGSPYSILFAPEMLIQTTITGQLSLLMLIEWHERAGIAVVSANTDGIVTFCPRDKICMSDNLIKEWQKCAGLEMETTTYKSMHSKDINNYIAIYE